MSMSDSTASTRSLNDYPLSLRIAAEALWGDDFWGRYQPKPIAPPPPRSKRAKQHR